MAHRIVVGITKEAQEAAARAGEPAAAVQEYELPQELVGLALDLGADVTTEGDVVLRWGVASDATSITWSETWRLLRRRPTSAADALDLISRREDERRAELAQAADERILRALEAPPEPLTVYLYPDGTVGDYRASAARQLASTRVMVPCASMLPDSCEELASKAVRERLAQARAERDRIIASARPELERLAREAEEARQREEEERAAAEARQRAVLDAAVELLGTPAQREAWAEGILAQREVIALIRRAVEATLADAGIRVTDSDEWSRSSVETLPTEAASELLMLRRRIEDLPRVLVWDILTLEVRIAGLYRETRYADESAEEEERYTAALDVVVGGVISLPTPQCAYTVVLS